MPTVAFLLLACTGKSTSHDDSHSPTIDSGASTDDSFSDSHADDSGAPADVDEDGWAQPDDCDDHDAAVHPDAYEACVNGLDDNCDGLTDLCDFTTEAADRLVFPEGMEYGEAALATGFLAAPSYTSELWILAGGYSDESPGRIASAQGKTWPVATIYGTAGRWARSIATNADLNDDGLPDLWIGGTSGDEALGWVWISPVGDPSAFVNQADGAVQGGGLRMINSSTAVGDPTADGIDDIVVLDANGWMIQGPVTGIVDLDTSPRAVPITGDAFRAAGADLDGDGIDDLATGSPSQKTAKKFAGAVNLYLGPVGLYIDPEVSDRAWHAPGAGTSIATGDFDHDGTDDIVVASGPSQEGWLYVLTDEAHDSGALATAASAAMQGDTNDLDFAFGLSASDFNSDGTDDIVMGTSHSELGSTPDGEMRVVLGPFFGTSAVADVANIHIQGLDNSRIGFSISTGDFENDGLTDFAVGSYTWDATNTKVAGGFTHVVTPALLVDPLP